MYKLYLVDDDVLVRTNVKLMLNEYANEVTVCGEASNGKDALDAIQALQPNIVISDMKMPIMDGLELCKVLRNQFPEITFIALSNYDEYDYLRGALKNGAADYILKHKLNDRSIIEIVRNAPDVSNYTKRYTNVNNSLVLRKKFVQNLISGVLTSKKVIEESMKSLNVRLGTVNVLPIILSIDNYNQFVEDGNIKKQNMLEFSVVNIVNEFLANLPNGLLTHISNENYCLLLSFENIYSQSTRAEKTQMVLQQISANLLRYLNLSVSFSIGTISNNITEIPSNYEKATAMLKNKFYSGNRSLLHADDMMYENSSLTGLDYKTDRILYATTQSGNIDSSIEILENLFSEIHTAKVSISNAQMIFADLVSILSRICKENGFPLNDLFINTVKPNELLSKLNTLQQIKEWFLSSFTILCKKLNTQIQSASEYIHQALVYINKNYPYPISLQLIADEIGISCGYLSTIFKNEVGQGLCDYLNTLRISKSTEYLNSGEKDLRKIASLCGFQEYSYFFKVFKKKLNLTPKGFIKKSGI